ncbi:MAG: hypothetical protein ACFCU2_06360 [Acidimicrobiia bacterium]
MKRSVVLCLMVLMASACGGDSATTTSEADLGETTVDTPNATSPPGAGETTTSLGESSTTSDRDLAPDFTLELGDGGSYTLSDGARPVYLVFWAEW